MKKKPLCACNFLSVFKLYKTAIQWCKFMNSLWDREGREGHDNKKNLIKGKGGPSPQIYRPGAGFVELDIISSLAFVALSLTLERGEMAFRGDDLSAP